jgi:hypothetical protein
MTRHPALSRVDNKTHICSECGTDEAMQAFAGKPLTMDTWHKNKSVYHPFVFVDHKGEFGDGEILVSVFIDADGNPTAQIARRDDRYQRWSPSHEMEAR